MKILLLDIETAPNLAYVWGTWHQNINPEWIAANGHVLCWSAKWYGERGIVWHRLRGDSPLSMLHPIHTLLDQADAVIHYNGTKFDIPTLNKEFVTHGLIPPSPYRQIDLLRTMRERFRFPSNKLSYVVRTLKLGSKIRHSGPQLWLDCMAGKPEAWRQMERYNKRDVTVLERLYDRLKPWIKGHPNVGAHDDAPNGCPTCGSTNFYRAGSRVTRSLKYQRFHCRNCGSWFRGNKSISPRGERYVGIA